jgi:uncharacterized protein
MQYLKTKARFVEVVLKIVERCNINCTYCYMFNRGNDDYLSHPVYLPDNTLQAIARFLAQGVEDLGAERVRIDFHGGEPLLLKRERFDAIASTLREAVEPRAKMEFGLQTNAMLVNQDWLDLLWKHRVGVGVSIDGPKEYHDAFRVDRRARGSYDRTVRGLRMLQEAFRANRGLKPGVLCVINPELDGRRIYRHAIDELHTERINFLLPMLSHDNARPDMAAKIGSYLCGVFDEWAKDDNPNIHVRILDQVMWFLTAGRGVVQALERIRAEEYALLTIASNGDLGPDDELKPLNFGQGTANVASTSMIEFLNSPMMTFVDQAAHSLPAPCKACSWQNYCRGGAQHGVLINRYQHQTGFDNPSVFCEGLKAFYSRVAAYLVSHGVPCELLASSLDYQSTPYHGPVPTLPGAYLKRSEMETAKSS